MGDNETGEEEVADQAEGTEDNSGADDQAEGTDTDKEADNTNGATTDEGDESTDDADEDEEPPTRKPRTNADWVALRRQRKLEKTSKGKEQGEADKGDDEAEEDEEDIADADVEVVEKIVMKHLAPIQAKEAENETKAEISEFIKANPDFAPFADKALKWSKHPTWKNVPIKQLMYAVGGEKLLKIGAKRQVEATVKANKTKTATNAGGDAGGGKPVWEMSDDEFAKEVERVKTGGK